MIFCNCRIFHIHDMVNKYIYLLILILIDVIILDTENKDLFQSNLDREKP